MTQPNPPKARLRKNMNACSQEKPNCLESVNAPISAPMPPMMINQFGSARHLDKSSGAASVGELAGELISYFLNEARICSGTSSGIPNWLSCSART